MTDSLTSLPRRALATFAALALSVSAFAADQIELRVGAISAADGRPVASGVWGVFDDKGWLKEALAKQNVKVRTIYLTGAGPAVNEAFANDTIDAAMYGDLPAIVGKAGGLDTVWLAGNSIGNQAALVVPSDSPVQSLADLKGKRIVVHKGRPWELGLALLLDEQGFKASDFKIYNVPEGQIPNTVAAGAVDAAFVSYTTALTIEKRNVGRQIWNNLKKSPHWRYTSELFATRKFTEAHPEIVQVLVDQWVRASAWAAQNEEEYTRIGAKSSGAYDIDVKGRNGLPVAQTTSPTIPEFRIEHYRRSAEFAKKVGYIRNDIDIPSWLNTSFLEKALKEQKLENFWPALDKEGAVIPAPAVH